MATVSVVIKDSKKANQLIYLQYVHDAKRIVFSTGIYGNPTDFNWIIRRGRKQIDKYAPFSHKVAGYSTLNKRVKDKVGKLEAAISKADENGDLSIHSVRSLYNVEKPTGKTISEAIDLVIETADIKKITANHYRYFKELLGQFKDLKIDQIDQAFYHTFVGHLKKQGFARSYIDKAVKNLKAVCNKMEAMGYDVHRDVKRFQRLSLTFDKVYLFQEEVEKLASFSDLSTDLKECKDLFVFHCHVGLRVSDFIRITKEWLHGNVLVVPAQKKTAKPITVPLGKVPMQILKKYNYQLPFRAEQVYNRNIKTICEKAGIDRRVEFRGDTIPVFECISSKAAKKTFVTYAISLGLSPNEIEVITGTNAAVIRKNYAGEIGIKDIAKKMKVKL